jgi:hypothetical protein
MGLLGNLKLITEGKQAKSILIYLLFRCVILPEMLKFSVLFVALALIFGSCDWTPEFGGRRTPLDALVAQLMSEGNFRDFDHHNYSLFYTAIPPNTIEIHIRYSPGSDQDEINKVVFSFKDMARNAAKNSFDMKEINFIVDMKEVKQP